jgi:hypothetical protein
LEIASERSPTNRSKGKLPFLRVLVEILAGLLSEFAGVHELFQDARGHVVSVAELLVDVKEHI